MNCDKMRIPKGGPPLPPRIPRVRKHERKKEEKIVKFIMNIYICQMSKIIMYGLHFCYSRNFNLYLRF